MDDAFITFRYALNLLQGNGLVYNPGEAILGTSTPLYAILLAAAGWLTGARALPNVALWINSLADAVAMVLVFQICRRLRLAAGPALLTSLIVALSPLVVRYSIGGMESSLLSAVLLLSAYLYLRGGGWMPFLLAGVAVWIRPDAMAYGAALVGAEAWRARRLPWRPMAVLAGCLAFEAVMLAIGYGAPVPQSVLAKAHHVYLADPATNFFQHIYLFSGLSLTGAQGFGARGLVVSPAPALDALPLIAFIPLAIIWAVGSRRSVRDEPRALVFPMFPLIFTAVYSLLGLRGDLMAEWYLVPLVPFWLIPLFLGLASIAEGVHRASFRPLVWLLPGALLVAELSGFNLGRYPGVPFALPLNVWTEREDLYLQAGAFLRDKVHGTSVVAASEIGALGYSCGCRVLDTVGLVSPSVSRYYPLPEGSVVVNYAVPTELIVDLQPEVLVSLEVFLRRTLLSSQQFLDEYHLVWQAPTDAFGSRGLMIYARRDLP